MSKAQVGPVSLLPSFEYKLSATAPAPCSQLPYSHAPSHDQGPSETISKPSIKCFPLEDDLVVVSLQGNRTVTKTLGLDPKNDLNTHIHLPLLPECRCNVTNYHDFLTVVDCHLGLWSK